MFHKILIANRGEIACRIIHTARRLGIKTVAVYSAADAGALHVRKADEAYAIGPAASAQSYLSIERIISAARASGAHAIHPGYGFLSENAEFAATCARAGLTFIGPSVDAIRIMGSKSEAKALVGAHGVPLVPGYYGADQSNDALLAAAREVGLPLLIKASAGGGGRGMRIVRDMQEFAASLASAQREAQSAFGDPAVLLERYVENPRHIEVQVFGDTHGNVVHLFERDCSLQRRHQKVIEEAPAVHLTDAQRAVLFEASLKAAHAVHYVGAGTVEFILDPQGQVYFIEMNTRLQVEHPITERITGLDLVEWQLRVAAGEPLPLRQSDITCRGHAVEVRVYAEDPDHDFRPSTGRLQHLRLPEGSEHVRVDTGVVQGDSVTPFYDAMIAKVITDGVDREAALRRMQHALDATEIAGVTTNIPYLQRIIAHADYATGGFNTHFVEDVRAALLTPSCAAPAHVLAVAAAARLADLYRFNQTDDDTVWSRLTGFRLNALPQFQFLFDDATTTHTISVTANADGWIFTCGETIITARRWRETENAMTLVTDDGTVSGNVAAIGDDLHVFVSGQYFRLHEIDPLHRGEDDEQAAGTLAAPMPGAVTAVMVKAGDKVSRGTPLLILEAMKIEHTISAPFDGEVIAVRFAVGEQVLAEGAELVKLEPIVSA